MAIKRRGVETDARAELRPPRGQNSGPEFQPPVNASTLSGCKRGYVPSCCATRNFLVPDKRDLGLNESAPQPITPVAEKPTTNAVHQTRFACALVRRKQNRNGKPRRFSWRKGKYAKAARGQPQADPRRVITATFGSRSSPRRAGAGQAPLGAHRFV